MTIPLPPGAYSKGLPLLLAQPPDPEPKLIVHTVKDGKWHVKAPDPPAFPSWQTRYLDLWLIVPPWIGHSEHRWDPLTLAETSVQERVAINMIHRLIDCLRQFVAVYGPLRSALQDYWAPLVLGTASGYHRSGRPLTDVDRVILATMIIFDLAMLVAPPGASAASPPLPARLNTDLDIVRKLSQLGPDVRQRLRQCLEQVGYNPDIWREIVLFGLLLHPQGMAWVGNPFFMGPTLGKTELERGLELAIGVPDTTYRSASKFHRAYRTAWGAAREPERPGPKPGQSRRTSLARQKFERYILDRIQASLSPQLIALDHEAQRLYRIVRNDHAVNLNEQVVRRVLRKHSDSDPSS